MSNFNLTVENMNQDVRHAEYAVRGAVPIRAHEIQQELKQGKKFNFSKIINCNIGNPQLLGQKPISFFREVVSLVVNPDLLKNDLIEKIYPKDVIDRANFILHHTPGGAGAYSHSQGLEFVRENVANFISKRDGYPCKASSIFLTQGASPGVQMILNMLLRDENDGILIPTPQYPLYSGSIKLYGGTALPYLLEEESNWSLSIDKIVLSIQDARKKGVNVRALVVINPGNPTGACLPIENIHALINLCALEKIVLLADEVYQYNIYQTERPFYSFRKALFDFMGQTPTPGAPVVNRAVELFSFHSVSKGYMGECGLRGGYLQMENIDPDIAAQIYKIASLQLCPNVIGQILVDVMVNPPLPGSPSHALYVRETEGIIQSLKRRAISVTKSLNEIPGVSCQCVEGSMYAFPSLTIPPKAVEEAAKRKIKPDLMYCLSLVEEEGLCCVPGSGFGQADGTYHLRTTILPPEEEMEDVILRFRRDRKSVV